MVELVRERRRVPLWTVMGDFADFSHNNIAQPDRRGQQHHALGARFQPRCTMMDLLFNDARGR